METYSIRQYSISYVLGLIAEGKIAIPDIQRPFVWDSTQVRDLIESLYNEYPIGYLVTWRSPGVRLKYGGESEGKQIIIDGQQRITSLMTAISGLEIINKDFKKERIKIAFNPLAIPGERYFATSSATTAKDKKWISDISELFKCTFNSYEFIGKYCEMNSGVKQTDLNNKLVKLQNIRNAQIGVIELDSSLDIDTVTNIFYRLNRQGTKLAQPDFVMSKIAADSQYGGNMLKKAIDTFCYLVKNPGYYDQIRNDNEFKTTDYFEKLKWLKDERNLIYEPDYNHLLLVAFMQKFSRSALTDLVSLLSGRDFETHEYREEIAEESFSKLREGVMEVIQKDNFKQFALALSNAGFTLNSLISSLAANFGYTLMFLLKRDQDVAKQDITRYLQKWYVMSVLTSRYAGTPESKMGSDLKEIAEKGFLRVLKEVEASELSSVFWRTTLPLRLEGTANNLHFKVYCATLIRKGASALLQNSTPNRNLIEIQGNRHHIFPKEYLKKNGVDKSQINQIANITYLDPQVNKAVSDSAPCEYFSKVFEQCTTKTPVYGDIVDIEVLKKNLQENCVPESIREMDHTRYSEFLGERRKLMAAAIEEYYKGL